MKEIKIGFPIEYEDENDFIKLGLFLRENEVKALKRRLTDGNKAKELQERINKAIEYYETHQQECVIGRNKDEKLIKDYYLPAQCSKKLYEILKGDE